MVNRNLYLKIIGSVSLIVLFALLGSMLLRQTMVGIHVVDNRYLLFLILCMSVFYPVDNSVANPVDKRYKP